MGTRTRHELRVRSYEIAGDGAPGTLQMLRWFQEAAVASSAELGFDEAWYERAGLFWVMREIDIEIHDRPVYDEAIELETWIATARRMKAWRQTVARGADGRLLARGSTLWIMLDRARLRPTRIPDTLNERFVSGEPFALEPAAWPEIDSEPYVSELIAAYHDEDEQGHVNNAIYASWLEENARRATGGRPLRFHRHRLVYLQPAYRDQRLELVSRAVPHDRGLRWSHEIRHEGEPIVRADGLSAPAAKESE